MVEATPKPVSAAMWPWLLEELEGDGGVDGRDTQHTHRGHATPEKKVFLGEALLGGVLSGKYLGVW